MSAAPDLDFEMHQGDDKIIAVHVQDPDGVTVSLAGVLSIKWQLAKKNTSATPLIQKSLGAGVVIVGDPADGDLRVTIDANDTLTPALLKGNYYHELEVIDSAGKFATVLKGTITVLPALIDNT